MYCESKHTSNWQVNIFGSENSDCMHDTKYDICKRLYLSSDEIVRSTTQNILLSTHTSFDFKNLQSSFEMV